MFPIDRTLTLAERSNPALRDWHPGPPAVTPFFAIIQAQQRREHLRTVYPMPPYEGIPHAPTGAPSREITYN